MGVEMKKGEKVLVDGREGIVKYVDGNAVTVKTANGEVVVPISRVQPRKKP